MDTNNRPFNEILLADRTLLNNNFKEITKIVSGPLLIVRKSLIWKKIPGLSEVLELRTADNLS